MHVADKALKSRCYFKRLKGDGLVLAEQPQLPTGAASLACVSAIWLTSVPPLGFNGVEKNPQKQNQTNRRKTKSPGSDLSPSESPGQQTH